MMSVTELERFVANKEKKVKKLEIEYQQKKKVVEETRHVLKLRKKLYARLRKQKQEEQRLRKGLEELDKEKAALDEMVSQVTKFILKDLSDTWLFTKYKNSELTEYTWNNFSFFSWTKFKVEKGIAGKATWKKKWYTKYTNICIMNYKYSEAWPPLG